MMYPQWTETLGQFRWNKEDGSSRTYVPLDYEWQAVYEKVTADADRLFMGMSIFDPVTFTQEFLSRVPIAWMKFKTSIEMFLGTLDGKTINPEEFHAGYQRERNLWQNTNSDRGYQENKTRDTTGTESEDTTEKSGKETTSSETGKETTAETNSVTSSANQSSENHIDRTSDENYEDIIGSREDNAKGRTINYAQGVQAYNGELNNNNIGQLGNDYASGFSDSVTVNNTGEQTNTGTKETTETENENGTIEQNGNSSGEIDRTIDTTKNKNETENAAKEGTRTNEKTETETGTTDGTETEKRELKEGETEKVTRINYYDQLAFLRERFDRIPQMYIFTQELLPLFQHIYSMDFVP